MHENIKNKISEINNHIQKVEDVRLKYELKHEMDALNLLIQSNVKKEFSYFTNAALMVASATGVILFWRGIYEISSMNTFLSNPYLSLAAGILILAVTGLISKNFLTIPGSNK